MEESEHDDWNWSTSETHESAMVKSINAYWVDKWIDSMKPFTFATYCYPITTTLEDACPDVLPFEKCMVRYSNKSPKDSPHWGPVSTRDHVLRLFATSLRCQSKVSSVLVIREWCDTMVEEVRCFWNRRCVAISALREARPDDPWQEWIAYVESLPIPYWRCVIDVARLSDGQFKLVEYNSWDSNSGGHTFDWMLDAEILYDVSSTRTVIRVGTRETGITDLSYVSMPPRSLPVTGITITVRPDDMVILPPDKPAHYVITDKYIYVCNDKFLGRFTKKLQPINWKVGCFRYGSLSWTGYQLSIGNKRFYDDLKPVPKTMTQRISTNSSMDVYPSRWRYGLFAQWNGNTYFCRLHYDGTFELIKFDLK